MVHPQVILNDIKICKGLEDLMATLWSQGITTYNSCIENTLARSITSLAGLANQITHLGKKLSTRKMGF